MNIENLRTCIIHERYEISLHAQKERLNENISLKAIETAIIKGKIIERYPEDKRGKSCLVFGKSRGKSIHIVCSILSNKWLRIITVYIPKRPKWINPEQRRK